MADEDFSSDRLTSEFNEAKFQILRLHLSWVQAKNNREHGDLMKLRWVLDSIELELWDDAERIDDESGKDDYKYIIEVNKLNDKITTIINSKQIKNLYDVLKEKEKLLRKLQNEAGKGAKYGLSEDLSL